MKARQLAETILALPPEQQELPICFLDHDFGRMEIEIVEKTDDIIMVFDDVD